jgi:putative ABC transport system permease protein
MDTLWQDLRYAVRSLRRQPGFALSAIGTLAVGIGATAAIFTIVNAVVLRPLPYPEPERMVAVLNFFSARGARSASISAPDFNDWREQSRSFDALAYYAGGETSVTLDGSGDYATVMRVTPGFFQVLGVRARLGRLLTPEEERPGGPLAAVVADAFWRRRLGADPAAIGRTMKFGERVYEIVGVLAPEVRFPARTDIYYPAWIVPETTSRSAHNYRVIGRLGSGVSLAQANEDLMAIARRLEQQYPTSNGGKLAVVVPLGDQMVADVRQTLFVLLAAVALVLIIACANVANLLLARATVRSREMVVRAAVGAGRGRLVRQLLTESVLLALVAGLAGILLAGAALSALLAMAPVDLPRLDEVRVDGAAIAFALAASLLASVLFGLAPAVQTSGADLAQGLRTSGKGAAAGIQGERVLGAFVVAEIALAVVLVCGAGLLGRSLAALASVDMGFETERLLVMRTAVPIARFDEAPRATAFYRDLLPDLAAIPGITSVAGVTSLPTAVRSNGGYWIEGGPGPEQLGIKSPQAILTVVTPNYFRTMGIPIRAGRDFTDADRRDAPPVAIVNESLAQAAFGGQDPIGRRLANGLDLREFMTIVGVVADVRTWGPSRPAQAEVYMPYEQHPGPATSLVLVARTTTPDPLALVTPVRGAIQRRNPDVPIRAEMMDTTMELASATPRFRTFLVFVFASVALLLSMIGVYGVMAYIVSHRVPEIGLRMALGASPGDVLRLIVGQGGRLAVAGLAMGLVLAFGASRAAESLLFGVTPGDPTVLVAVVVVVSVAALSACYLPARRALAVEPMTALRNE